MTKNQKQVGNRNGDIYIGKNENNGGENEKKLHSLLVQKERNRKIMKNVRKSEKKIINSMK